MDKEKIYKTIEVVVKAILAIAAIWFCVSCTMSLSVSKHNTNSHQNTEQSQATSVDSTTVTLTPR
uniref:Lipoprotein n=1 Tax=Dulem virus 231 TaxID=3145708 RepID=A0AAU8AUN2_9VIRU